MRILKFIIFFLNLFLCGAGDLFAQDSHEEGYLYFERGQKAFNEMRYDRALSEYSRAVKINPDNYIFCKAIAELYGKLNNNAEEYRHTANFYSRTGHFNKALRFYKKLLSVQKKDTDAMNAIGNIYYWQGRYGKALRSFNESLKIAPNTEALLGKGNIYFSKGLFIRAKYSYKRALSIDRSNIFVHKRLAQLYEMTGCYNQCLIECSYIIKNKVNDAQTWNMLGWLRELNGELEISRNCYNKAMEFETNSPEALQGLARIEILLGNHSKAAAFFKNALKKSEGPQCAGPLNGLGWLSAWEEDYANAFRYFYRSISADPVNNEARIGLGWIYSRQEDFDKAIKLYEDAKAQNNIAVQNGLAWVFTQQGEHDKAIQYYSNILKIAPKNIEAYNGLGLLYLKLDNADFAEKFYKKSLMINNRNPGAYYGMAQIQERKGRFSEAIENYSTAIRQNPLNLYYKKAAALCYIKNKDYAHAMEIMLKLVSEKTKDTELLEKLAFLYAKFKKTDEAKELYARILEIDPASTEAIGGISDIFLTEGDYDKAGDGFKKILSKDPNNRTAHKGLANVYRILGYHDKAILEYEKLITLKYNDVESWNSLGWLYFQKKTFTKTIDCYSKGLDYIKNNPDGLVGISYAYLELLRQADTAEKRDAYFKKANRNCRIALAKNPYYTDAYLCLSKLYLSVNKYGNARRLLVAAKKRYLLKLKDNPKNRDILKQLINIEKELYNAARAKDYVYKLERRYKNLFNSKINDASLWIELAAAYKLAKEYDKGINSLQTALGYADKNNHTIAMLCLADLYLLKRDFKRAKEIYDNLSQSQLQPAEEATICYGLGKICEKKNKLSRCIDYYQRAVDKKIKSEGLDFKEARLALARALSKNEYLNKAIKVYEGGFLFQPVDNEYSIAAYRELGELYMKKKSYTIAKCHYEKCLTIVPGDIDALIGLAHIARYRHDYGEAISRYNEVLTHDANNSYIHRMLGDVYFWSGDYSASTEEYKSALKTAKETDEKKEITKDIIKLKRIKSPSLTARSKYSESKEDDTGKQDYIIKTEGADFGANYRQPLNNNLSFNIGYSRPSIEEKYIQGSETDFDIYYDNKTLEMEYKPSENFAINGFYNNSSYENNKNDISSQRTPLRANKTFNEYKIGALYRNNRNSYWLKALKEPMWVKIFEDNPELDFYSTYPFLCGIDYYLTDAIEIRGEGGCNYYAPSSITKALYQISAQWQLYKHEFSLLGSRKILPLTSFTRANGFSVLGINSVSVGYSNDWIKHLALKVNFEEEFYSNDNRSIAINGGVKIGVPCFDEKLSFGYNVSYEDFKFTAQTIEGEPLYRSPQNLFINSFSISYDRTIGEKLNYFMSYAYTISNKNKHGNSGYIRGAYSLNDTTVINADVSIQNDASFAEERKGLIYVTKYFF